MTEAGADIAAQASPMTRAQKVELILLQEAKYRRYTENRLAHYKPYAKQKVFHDLGRTKRERLLRAGNQLGKTLAGSAEVAMHLTGKYPEWWTGKRFKRPNHGMAGSESAELTRKGVQRLLLGPPADRKAWGTGMIPKDCIVSWSMRAGVADAVASITVKHYTDGAYDGNSTIQFASYDQGRTKWQADTLDWVWFDEEPPPEVYSEGITRTNTTMGPVILTMTPLMGMSDVVRRFYPVPDTEEKADICMTIMDVEHYTDEERAKIIASYPEHEREARISGIPMLGSGRIFPIAQETITCPAFAIPDHWVVIGGLDFGYDHPTAAAKLAWDRDADVIYVTAVYKRKGSDLAQTGLAPTASHAAAVKPWGAIPWAWPHDGLQHDKGSGEQLAQQYRDQALDMLQDKATHPAADGEEEGTGGNSVEAGITDMLERMQTGRWKVFDHLEDWLAEFRLYHRKDGKIVKEFDDAISASRYAYMMRRFARTAVKKKALDKSKIFRR